MATTNNAVTVSAGLSCTALSSPPIGSTGVSASLAYTDGDPAIDQYISVVATGSPGTALHNDLAANGFVFVFNPATSTGAVTLFVGTTELGPLPVGFGVVVPVASGSIIKATVASTAITVGVTAIKTSANV